MGASRRTSQPLEGWTVLSLRPRGQHAGLRTAAARHGASALALSPFAIVPCDDAAALRALREALSAEIVLYTSPNAVAQAADQQPLRPRHGQRILAIGSSTQRALHARGVAAHAPARMDSEGVLGLADLDHIAGKRLGLVTGRDGRNLIAPALRARGAEVTRADIYRRAPLAPTARALVRLERCLADPRRCLLPVSSGDALQQVLEHLPAQLRRRLLRVAVVAASKRLADIARAAGFQRIAVAADARPASLLRAAHQAFDAGPVE